MTDLDDFILSVIEDKAPIRNEDLLLEIAKHQHGVNSLEITESLKRLNGAGKLMEVEYVLPKNGRAKMLYFPKGTKLV